MQNKVIKERQREKLDGALKLQTTGGSSVGGGGTDQFSRFSLSPPPLSLHFSLPFFQGELPGSHAHGFGLHRDVCGHRYVDNKCES